MKELGLIFYLFFTLIFSILFIFTESSEYSDFYLLIPFILFLFFIFIKILNNKNTDWFSLDMVFFILFYLIHFGYLFTFSLGLSEYESEVFWNSNYMNSTIILASCAISSYLAGFSLISPKTEYKSLQFYHNKENQILIFAKFLMILVFMMFWLPILSILEIALIDYESLIRVGELSPIGKLYWIGQYLAIFCLSVISLSYFKKRKLKSFFVILAFIYIISYFIIGDRGGFIYYAIIPLLAYHYFYKKVNMSKLTVSLFIVLLFSSVISVSRVSSTYNPVEAYKLYKEAENKDNPVLDSITEFGKSIKTVNIVVSNFPENYDYWYGKSYVDSFLIIFPNFFSNRTSDGIDTWLTENFFGKYTYGRGGSMLMESYGNFGFIGTILFFNILGLLSGSLYRKTKSSNNFLYFIVYLAFSASICIWMRNTSSYLFRTLAWTVFLYYIILFLIPYLPKKIRIEK